MAARDIIDIRHTLRAKFPEALTRRPKDVVRPARLTPKMKARLKVLERADPFVARLVQLYLVEGRAAVARRYASRIIRSQGVRA